MITIETHRDADYRQLLELQRERFTAMCDMRRCGITPPDEWIMRVEHRSVYTLGRHGHHANLIHPEMLSRDNTELVEIERGGDITWHGPGQLVVYPIIDLQKRHLGVKAYINILEQAVIDTIGEFCIEGQRIEGATGVWVDNPSTGFPEKICAIGVKCSRFITMHGLALNVNPDLSHFSAINPCGFTDRGVTSIANLSSATLDASDKWLNTADRLTANLLNLLQM